MRASNRVESGGGPNALARARAELSGAGVGILDLSDSNPTRHGLMRAEVLDTLARHVADAARYEPDPRGHRPARAALAARYGGDPDDYWLTASTSQAYSWLTVLLADPGQAIAVPAPGYPLIEPLARFTGVRTIEYRSHYVHPYGWVLDCETLGRAVRGSGTRAVVVVNPGNPTGAYLGAGTRAVLDACERGGLALIVDEVFEPFVLDGPATTMAGQDRVPTFTLGGLSKLLCAPQLKLGWIRLSGPAAELPRLRDGLDTIADAFLPVSAPVAAALPELLAIAPGCVAATRARLATNLAAARAGLADDRFRVRRCGGGWTVLVDVPARASTGDLALRLLRRAHLSVHPGWFYDLSSDRTLALSLLPEPARFADGVRRLRDAVDELAGTIGNVPTGS